MPTFTPPSTEYSYETHERLWMFFRSAAHGMSLIRWMDATYSLVETVTTDEFDEASFIYLGGHVYEVDDEEAAALIAAGYGAGISADVVVSTSDSYSFDYDTGYGVLTTEPGPPADPYPPPDTGGGGAGGGGTGDGGFGSSGFGSSGFGG